MAEGSGPPEFVDIPDVAALEQRLEGQTGPHRVQYRRGPDAVVEEVAAIATDRGGQIAELHYDDGRYVTVNVERELDGLEVTD